MLRYLHGLLECRAVLERERRDRDRARDRRAVLIEALRVGVVGAVALAIEGRRIVGRQRLLERRLQRHAALRPRPAPAVPARPATADVLARVDVAQVL